MHINEQFLTKLTPAEVQEICILASKLDASVTGSMSGAYTKALTEQLARLGV